MELGSYFWFLQEQIKDIIIIGPTKAVTYPAVLVDIQHPAVADAHPVVSAQNWFTSELLCGRELTCHYIGGVANILAEELEPLWLAALLLGVLEAFDKN